MAAPKVLEPIGVEAIASGVDAFTAKMKQMESAYDRAKQSSGTFTDSVNRMAGNVASALSGAGREFAAFGQKIATGALVAGIGAVAAAIGAVTVATKEGLDSLMKWGEQVDRLIDQFGMTGEEASAWTVAMNRVGLTVEEGGQGLNFFTKNLADVKSAMAEWVPAKTTEQVEKLQQQIDDETVALQRAQIKMASAKKPTQEMAWAISDHEKKLERLNDEYANATALVPAAAEKTSAFQQALDKLGVSVYDNTGKARDYNDLMPEIMDKFAALPPGIEASNLAMELFGARGGTKFLDMLRQGSAGLADSKRMAEAFGLSLSTDQANAIEKFGFSLQEMGLGLTGIKNQFALGVLPYAQKFIDFLLANIPTVVEFARVVGEKIGGVLQVIADLFGKFQAGGVSGLLSGLGLPPEAQESITQFVDKITELAGVVQGKLNEAFAWVGQNAIPLLMQGLDWVTNVGLPAISDAIDFVTQHWDAFSGAIMGVLVGGGVLATIAIVGGAIAALTSPIGLVISACAALGAAWATDFLGIRTTLTKFWNDAQPVLQKVWDWLAVNAPIAIDKLVNYWNDYLLPIFNVLAAIIFDTVLPVLGEVVKFFLTTIPDAIQAVSAVWNTVLLPAIQGVINWVKTYVVPTFEALNKFLDAVLGLTLRVLAGLWENVILPAMKKVWDFLKVYLQPAFEAFGKALQFISDNVFAPLENGLKEIAAFLIQVRQKLDELTTALNNATLPSWLQPGSPTPFELGLRGISSALDQVSGKAAFSISPNVARASIQPAPASALGRQPAQQPAPAGGGMTLSIGPVTINSQMDLELFGAFVERHVAAAWG